MKNETSVDVDMMRKAVEVMKTFKGVTTIMSSQKDVTASLVKPLLHKLILTSKPVEGDPRAIHQAKANLYHDLLKR